MRTVPPSESTTSLSQCAGYSAIYGHDDGAAVDRPVAQALVRNRGVVECEALDVRAQLARARELEHLRELEQRAPVGGLHRCLVGHRHEVHRQRAQRQADDRDVAADAHRARRDRQRRVGADEVDDELRAVAVRRGFDASCDVIVRVPRFVGADGAREVELRVRRVDGDHARRGECAQDLHCHVSETADTDDDRGRARNERSARARDGVVRRQRGVAERRGLDRIEISEWDEQAVRGDEHVLRHAAVAPEPAARAVELARVLAVVLGRLATRPARTTTPRSVDRHRVAGAASARHRVRTRRRGRSSRARA